MLPQGTQLGILTIIEIYHFYNMPVLFASQNKAGNLYMATWVDEQEREDTWLYTPISIERFAQVRQGKIDLHDVFADPEDGILFEAHVGKFEDDQDYALPIHASELDQHLQPQPSRYINLALLPPIKWESIDQTQGAVDPLVFWQNKTGLSETILSETLNGYLQKIHALERQLAQVAVTA